MTARKPAAKPKKASAKKTAAPKVKTVRATPAPAQDKCECFGIEAICAMILQDVTQGDIAAEIGVSPAVLSAWLAASPERSARVRASREQSAQACDDKAEGVLLALRDDSSPAAVTRARELASHYRWRAKVRNPRDFGDKQEVTATVTVAEMTSEERQQRINAIIARANAAAAAAGQ